MTFGFGSALPSGDVATGVTSATNTADRAIFARMIALYRPNPPCPFIVIYLRWSASCRPSSVPTCSSLDQGFADESPTRTC